MPKGDFIAGYLCSGILLLAGIVMLFKAGESTSLILVSILMSYIGLAGFLFLSGYAVYLVRKRKRYIFLPLLSVASFVLFIFASQDQYLFACAVLSILLFLFNLIMLKIEKK